MNPGFLFYVPPAISYQLSAISYQLSAISYQLMCYAHAIAFSYQLSVIGRRPR
ncbi:MULTISPECIES: hypothetical protein [unclassified Moorena]|uniref:hypothetical protein n=1 Tax=unclassified Moorena TaxID=2683338 RepID=UPI00257A2190|nr:MULTISPECIES: hypothetical protein [unclassified Moorena]